MSGVEVQDNKTMRKALAIFFIKYMKVSPSGSCIGGLTPTVTVIGRQRRQHTTPPTYGWYYPYIE